MFRPPLIKGQRLSGQQMDDLKQAQESHLTPEQKAALQNARAAVKETEQARQEAERAYLEAAERGNLNRAESANRKLATAKAKAHAAVVNLAVTLKAFGLSD